MQIDDYFDFLPEDEIRIKGHRIYIEDVLIEYIYRDRTAEQIARRFPTLTLDQVYACILYYLRNKEAMHGYLTDLLEYSRKAREEQEKQHPEWIERMRRLKRERNVEGKFK